MKRLERCAQCHEPMMSRFLHRCRVPDPAEDFADAIKAVHRLGLDSTVTRAATKARDAKRAATTMGAQRKKRKDASR